MTKELLLVEDDDGHAALIQAVLGSEPGISVRVVRTGREALGLLALDPDASDLPDAVLLDIDLPDLSGFEVLRELARHGIARRIPVLVYTTAGDPAREARAMDLGAAAFVEKPSDFSELVPLIRKHLDHSKGRRRPRRRWFG